MWIIKMDIFDGLATWFPVSSQAYTSESYAQDLAARISLNCDLEQVRNIRVEEYMGR